MILELPCGVRVDMGSETPINGVMCPASDRCASTRRAIVSAALSLVCLFAIGFTAAATEPTTAPVPPAPAPFLPPVLTQPDRLSSADAIEIRSFRFEGNCAISTTELSKIAQRVRGQYPASRLNAEQIEAIRQALTEAYFARGYINSGALLKDQTIADGVITFTILEGRLSRIEVESVEVDGKSHKLRIRRSYVTSFIKAGVPDPLNLNVMRDRLEVLRQDPSIKRINAELKPGDKPGESMLDVRILDAPRVIASLSFSNHHSASAGAERFDAALDVRDPTGFGDMLAITYGITEGGFNAMKFSGVDNFSIDYTIPISPQHATLNFDLQRSNDTIVEDQFADLGITSDSWSYAITFRQPIFRRSSEELALFVTGAYRTNESELLGEPFAFSPGAENGRTAVTALRLGTEFTRSTDKWALTLRSTITIGINAFGATEHFDNLADGQFVSWLGQAQYVRRIGEDNRLVVRGGMQLADDSLLSLEQFTIGGVDTVRGYRENRLVRDSGVVGSVELHLPVKPLRRGGVDTLEFVPFVDAGYGRNHAHKKDDDPDKFISSVGVGLIFSPSEYIHADVFYGYPLNPFPNRDDLQDLGIHFNISIGMSF